MVNFKVTHTVAAPACLQRLLGEMKDMLMTEIYDTLPIYLST